MNEGIRTFDGHDYCMEHLPSYYRESDLVFGTERVMPCEVCRTKEA